MVASVLMEQDNKDSEPFWYSFYKKRDELLSGVRVKSKGRLRISVDRELRNFLKISRTELFELCKVISVRVGETYWCIEIWELMERCNGRVESVGRKS